MDTVQNDLNLLGIKQVNGDGYNIHIPPLPRDGKDQTSILSGESGQYCCW